MAAVYDSEEKRWQAIQQRDVAADGCFFYGVASTGIFCYPSCPSRAALRENTYFYDTRVEAQRAGLRACKRCRSDGPSLAERHRQLIETACRLIAQANESMKVDELAKQLTVSRFHLQKLFQQYLGMGPKQYIKAVRALQLDQALATSDTLTEAYLQAGYDSSSSFYADGARRLGMPAKTYRRNGEGMSIVYAFGKTRIGLVLVAATEYGICSVLFGENQLQLLDDLRQRFGRALLNHDDEAMQTWLAGVVESIESPTLASQLPLDIQGTVFQEKVWLALREILPGKTASYSQIAASIGKPNAARAVAQACSSNSVAVLIPCHRVVAANGDVSGYRWGVERKRQLLEFELASCQADERQECVQESPLEDRNND